MTSTVGPAPLAPFQAGDEGMTLRNDRRLHLRNGERGTVVAVDGSAFALVAFTTGATVVLPADYLGATPTPRPSPRPKAPRWSTSYRLAHGVTDKRNAPRSRTQAIPSTRARGSTPGRMSTP